MAVRLVRKASETPNITNRDDVKMVRYAYGGYNGIVKNYGRELLPFFSGGELHLSTGRIVLQGWEVDLDGDGWGFISSISSGSQYYVAYLELSLITETAEIKTTYKTGSYPEIDPGDDLTQFPSGIARLPLCQFQIVNGKIAEANRVAPVIPYLTQKVLDLENDLKKLKDDVSDGTVPAKIAQYASSDESKGTIEDRLTRLGFKKGQAVPNKVSYSDLTENEIIKIGTAVCGKYYTTGVRDLRYDVGEVLFQIPTEFAPYANIEVYGGGMSSGAGGNHGARFSVIIDTSGTARLYTIDGQTNPSSKYLSTLVFLNYGYTTVNPSIYEE